MATTIATGALQPKIAVTIAAILNFVGAFISLKVAATVAGGIVDAGAITPTVVFGGLVGAIAWNLATWWFGLPSSSSHALIGGVVGATFVAAGSGAVEIDGIVSKVIIPALASPIVAGLVAALGVCLVYRLIRGYVPERSEREFRWAQVASSSMVALAHGTNDAQKTMGVISLALIANGTIKGGAGLRRADLGRRSSARPRSRSAPTPAAGGSSRRSARRSSRCARRRASAPRPWPPRSSSPPRTSAIPLSTTQVVSGAVTGSGVGRPGAKVNWAVARQHRLRLAADAAGRGRGRRARLRRHRRARRRRRRRRGGRGDRVIAAFLLWRANRAGRGAGRDGLREPGVRPARAGRSAA